MSEPAAAVVAPAAAAKPKSKLPLIAAILIAGVGGAGGVYFALGKMSGGAEHGGHHVASEDGEEDGESDEEEEDAEEEEPAAEEGHGGHGEHGEGGEGGEGGDQRMVPLEPIVTNIAPNDEGRLLRVTMHLRPRNAAAKELVLRELVPLRDRILLRLSSLTVADTEGAEKKHALQEELVALCNEELHGRKVSRIYFSEFVVQ